MSGLNPSLTGLTVFKKLKKYYILILKLMKFQYYYKALFSILYHYAIQNDAKQGPERVCQMVKGRL